MRKTRAYSAARLVASCIVAAIICVNFAAMPQRARAQGQAQTSSQAVPMSISQYAQDLQRVQADCETASEAEGDGVSSARAIAGITPLLHVTILEKVNEGGSGGELVFADNRPLAGLMQAAGLAQAAQDESAAEVRSDRWSSIAADIGQVRASLPGAGDAGPSGDARALADQVLAGSDFASEPLPPKSVWDRMGDAIVRWLSRLHFPHAKPIAAPTTQLSPIVPEIILIVIGATAIGLIVYFTVVWLRERGVRTKRQQRASQLDLAFTAEEKELVATHNYDRLRVLADEAAQSGDFRSGYRLMFLAILVYLDAEGAIRLDRAKTNWEYLRSLPSGEGLREILRPVVREFDRIWYGERPAAQREYDLVAQAFTATQSQIDSTRAPLDLGKLTAQAASGAAARPR